jgi:ATP/maltotriose-dependent transcriptional regulator MalT
LTLAAARRGDLVAARSAGEEGLAVCREIGDRWFISYFLWILASEATAAGDIARARAEANESLRVAREVQGPVLIVCALEASAGVAWAQGDLGIAEAQLAEAEKIGRSDAVPGSYLATVLRARGELVQLRGDLMETTRLLEDSLTVARHIGDAWSITRALSNLAMVARRRNDFGHAKSLIDEAVTIAARIGDLRGLAESRAQQEAIAEALGEVDEGERSSA